MKRGSVRDQTIQASYSKMRARCSPGQPIPEPVPSDENPQNTLSQIHEFIDRNIDNLLFEKLGLQRNYAGGSSHAGELTKTFGTGITADEVKNFVSTGTAGYGTEGKTLA